MKRSQASVPAVLPALLLIALLGPGGAAGQEQLPPGDSPPPTSSDRIKAAGVAADHEDADYVIVYDKAVNRMKDSGVTYVDSEVLYKTLTPQGCQDLSVLHWNYDPQSSYVDVREVNVLRGDEVIPVDVGNVHDLPAPQRAIYWSDRIKTLQLPRLEVNDGIEVKVFRKGYTYALLEGNDNSEPSDDRYIPPMAGEYFDIVLFEAAVPTVEKKYELVMPRVRGETGEDRRLHAEVYNGPIYSSTRYQEESVTYSWWAFDIPAVVHEPRQPGQSDYGVKVVMSTAESWEAKSRWFFDVNRNQFEPNQAIRDKVAEVCEEAGVADGTEAQKAEVLVHWVAQNIRYSGQTMGEGEGFTLHPGPMIFEQRSGVCKDIASMLICMMRAADMDSYGAMTMAGSRIEDLPADQFNHCVCALCKADGSGWEMYDPTWVPFNHDIWSRLETEQQYLIGSPKGEDLNEIPYSPPEKSRLGVRHDARILDDGTLVGTFRFDGVGALDSRLRRVVNRRLRGLEAYFAEFLAPISDRVEDIRYNYRPVDDVFHDMWIELTYRVPEFALPVGDGFEFKSPMMQVVPNNLYLFRAAQTDWDEERKTDVFLYYTELVDGTETIRLPKGYEVVETPATEEIDETYASFKGWSESSRKELVIHQKAEVKRRQIPPEGFPGFYKAMQEVDAWADQVFRATKGGES
jgi:hypothetical protein